MPRKKAEEVEQTPEVALPEEAAAAEQNEAALLAESGEAKETTEAMEATAVPRESDLVAPVASTVADTDLVASVTDGSEESEEETTLAENEVLPTTISKGTATAAGKELPEYLQRRRTEVGRVVSNKMQKTVVVSVERSKLHPLYKKVVRQTVKFMAHDEMSSGMGDTVRIIESRPMSRQKRWQVVEIVQKAEQI